MTQTTFPDGTGLRVLTAFALALALGALVFASGCQSETKKGNGARDLIAKLPAEGLNGFVSVSLPEVLPHTARLAAIYGQAGDHISGSLWLAKIDQVVMVMNWGAESVRLGHDCDSASKNVERLITAKFGRAPLAVSKVRKRCNAAPVSAGCLAEAKAFEDIDRCIEGAEGKVVASLGSAEAPNVAFVVAGTFDAEAVATELSIASIAARQVGLDLPTGLSFESLERGIVAIGDRAQVLALKAAWSRSGDVPRLVDHPQIREALATVDTTSTVVAAGYELPVQTRGASISGLGGALDLRGVFEMKVWTRGGQTIADNFQVGLGRAKRFLRRIHEDKARFVAQSVDSEWQQRMGIEVADWEDFLHFFKELVHGVEVVQANRTVTVTTSADVDPRRFLNKVFIQLSRVESSSYYQMLLGALDGNDEPETVAAP